MWRDDEGNPHPWPTFLGANITIGCALRVANEQGWWDGAGYHRDEVQLIKRWKAPENKGPAFTSGTPGAATLTRMAA